jgi:hypothetical protein
VGVDKVENQKFGKEKNFFKRWQIKGDRINQFWSI